MKEVTTGANTVRGPFVPSIKQIVYTIGGIGLISILIGTLLLM